MREKRKASRKPIALLAAAAVLLLLSTVGSARAALTYVSENYTAEVTVSSIGVSLTENGETVSRRDYNHKDDEWNETTGELLKNMLAEGEELMPGKVYPERIGVTNSGSIDTYVRVIITKSWMDAQGKDTTLSPALIDLNLLGNGWLVDGKASTEERTVLYYSRPLAAGSSAPDVTDTLKIDSAGAARVPEPVEESGESKTVTPSYDYNGYSFHVEAEVDAVQTHNAQDAIKSAWGVDVEISADGSLSLK